MELKYYRVCRAKCLSCGDVLEHVNRSKQDGSSDALVCTCKKVLLDPAACFYRIVGDPEQYEDLSEEWED